MRSCSAARVRRARGPRRPRRARSRRWRRSCRGGATGSCCRPRTSRATSPARALQVRARAADPARADTQPALRILVHSGARALPPVQAARAPMEMMAPARGGLAPRRLRRLRRGATTAREGAGRIDALPRAARSGEGEPRWSRAVVFQNFPFGRTPTSAAALRSRVDALARGGFELIDYKTGHAAGAPSRLRERAGWRVVCGGGARSLGDRGDRAHLLLTCSTTPRVRLGSRRRGPLDRGDPSTRSRSAILAQGVSSRRRRTRSARCASTGSPARRRRSRRAIVPSVADARKPAPG